MNAPKVNSEIESGRCSVSIPANIVKDFFYQILTLKKLSSRSTKNGKMSLETLIYACQRGLFAGFVLSL